MDVAVTKQEQVVLVDEFDNELGTMEKLEAHEKGLLHRAISVFIFNTKGELLLQQRADRKYHCGGLWTNTCCSHPRQNEDTLDAAHRRLKEEMGMKVPLEFSFAFTYKSEFANGLTEHEFDHVFFGESNTLPILNPEEASAFKYMSLEKLKADIEANPSIYTDWLKICLKHVIINRK